MGDHITISNLELLARIGVSAEEREKPQRLTASIILHPLHPFERLEDRLENTVDYALVCEFVRTLASKSQTRLLETLAEQTVHALMKKFPLAAVEIELRKYILPETEYVAVTIRRDAARRNPFSAPH